MKNADDVIRTDLNYIFLKLTVYDPVVQNEAKKVFETNKIIYSQSGDDLVDGLEMIILFSRWPEIEALQNFLNASKILPLLIDGRRMVDKNCVPRYEGIGV
jgi:UDPglucose 6-dehydrogenase/GDP-mannose 6-dehydrogenase